MKRYVKVKNGKIIDTMLLLPHVECYLEVDSKLYVESIDGVQYYLGKIAVQSDVLKDLV